MPKYGDKEIKLEWMMHLVALKDSFKRLFENERLTASDNNIKHFLPKLGGIIFSLLLQIPTL
jgi:hypothetical protein